jgi:hypothetical protein
VTVFSKYMDLLIPLGATILGVVVAVKAYQAATTAVKVAQEAWNVVQVAFNVIMAANPILLVVIAIAALVAGIIVAYKNVAVFRRIVDTSFQAVVTAFGWITTAAKAVFDWLKKNWPLVLAILTGPFGLAVLTIVRHWDTIKGAATAAFDTIKGAATDVYDWVVGKFEALVDFLAGLIDRIAGIGRSIANAIKNPINAIIRAWNGLEFRIPRITLPKVEILGQTIGGGSFGGQSFGFPTIPTLATGGVVLRTGLALVHEGEQFSGVGRSFGGTTVNIHVNTTGLGADSPDIQRAVMNALRGYASRNGALDLPVRGV